MKRFSLFGSAALATCLGLNALVPAVATEFTPNYRYEGLPPNRLRTTTAAPPAATNATPVPWYENLPELRTPTTYTHEASQLRSLPDRLPRQGNEYSETDDYHNYFVRQQSQPVIGEVESLPPGQHAFDSMIQSPNSYPMQQEGAWDPKHDWGTKDVWGGGARHRFGVRNAGCGTLWMAAVDFYYLTRTTTSPVTVLVDDTTRAIEEFNAQSLGFGENMGYGLRLSRDIGCCTSVNFGYFGIYDQQAATELTGDLALVVPGFPTGGNPASYNSDYQSQLHSAEVNIRQGLGGRFGLSAGLRYINLNEDFLISSQLGAVVTLQHYDITTNNNLFGAQFGTDVCLVRWRNLQFDAFVNCGFYLNNASQTTSSVLIGPAVTATNDAFAVAGSAGIFATYCFNNAWSVRAGYQVLGLHGVALAPEQLYQSNLATSTAGIDTTGSAFYSGASLGLQYAW